MSFLRKTGFNTVFFGLGALLRPGERSGAAGILGDHRQQPLHLGADPVPWLPSVAAAGIQRGRDPGDHRQQPLHLGADPAPWRRCCGRWGRSSTAGIRKISGSSCFTWVRIRRPGGAAAAGGEIRRRWDPGRSPAAAASPGCGSWRPGGRPWPLREIRRGRDPGRSPAAAASPGCGSGALAAVRGRCGRSGAAGILGDHRQQPLHLGADPGALAAGRGLNGWFKWFKWLV